MDDASLAKDTHGIIAVRGELRRIRDRVAYDIKKLSKFAGDGGSDAENDNDNPNPFYEEEDEGDDVEGDETHETDFARVGGNGNDSDNTKLASGKYDSEELASEGDSEDDSEGELENEWEDEE